MGDSGQSRLRFRLRLQSNGLTPTPVPTPLYKKILTPVVKKIDLTPTPVSTQVMKKYLTPVPTPTPNCQKMESTPGMTLESESPIFEKYPDCDWRTSVHFFKFSPSPQIINS